MTQLADIYNQDFYTWTVRNAALLREGRFNEADIGHLIEELESTARRDRSELISRLIILLAHLLKWQFQPERQGRSWEDSIAEQRVQIAEQLECSPGLTTYFAEALLNAYPKAIKLAARETRLSAAVFPEICAYSVEQILDEDFYPRN